MYYNANTKVRSNGHGNSAMWQLLLYLTTHGGIVERLKRVLVFGLARSDDNVVRTSNVSASREGAERVFLA
jgi:hypothetical protein